MSTYLYYVHINTQTDNIQVQKQTAIKALPEDIKSRKELSSSTLLHLQHL